VTSVPDDIDAADEARDLQRAIRVWALAYAIRYRAAPDPKPGRDDARNDLLRWTSSYCGLSTVERAAAFAVTHPSAKMSRRADSQMATTAGCLIFRSTEIA
jgi:hypothetical protein